MDDVDIAVVGGGTAGLIAAQVAAAAGREVLLIERGNLGGECTWTGCVPSKTLLEAARLRHDLGRAGRFGIGAGDVEVDFRAVMLAVRKTIDLIAGFEDGHHLAQRGITVRRGTAVLGRRREIRIDGEAIQASRIILCTGSRPALPAVEGLEEMPYHTNETIFGLDTLPAHLVVLGAGAVGLELGQAFRRLGSRVTIIEAASSILPSEDPDVRSVLQDALAQEGIDFILGVTVERPEHRHGLIRLVATGPGVYRQVEGDILLVATGRRPAIEGLGLQAAGVRVRRAGIEVDERLRTSAGGIYAAGDVTGVAPFTHVAAYQGRIAAVNALGKRARADYRVVPEAVFTDPPLARVGLTEPEARKEHGDIRVTHLPYSAIDRAVIERDLQGAIKVITGKRTLVGEYGGGEVLGAHVVGTGAPELIHEFVLAMQARTFAGRLAQAIHAYPTYALGIQMAAGLLFPAGKATVDRRDELVKKPPPGFR